MACEADRCWPAAVVVVAVAVAAVAAAAAVVAGVAAGVAAVVVVVAASAAAAPRCLRFWEASWWSKGMRRSGWMVMVAVASKQRS